MKDLRGIVTTLATPKTAQVIVTRQWAHPLYKKSVKRTKRYACHYENIELVQGDEVLIRSIKPMSKTKKFVIVEKVKGNK